MLGWATIATSAVPPAEFAMVSTRRVRAYWGGPFLRACFFLRCEDQKRAPSLSYLYVVFDKKGSLLLGCDLGKAPD